MTRRARQEGRVFGHTVVRAALREHRVGNPRFSLGLAHADLDRLSHSLAYAAESDDVSLVRRFCRVVAASKVRGFANRAANFWQTPLCLAAGADAVASVDMLVEFGADIDLEGCPEGSPLMLACAYGRFSMVKFLFRMVATLEYTNEMGEYRNPCVHSGRHAHVVEWYLLGRFQEQRRLGFGPAGGSAGDVRCWSGVRLYKLRVKRGEQQGWGESMFELLCRSHKFRVRLRGQVVPNRGLGED